MKYVCEICGTVYDEAVGNPGHGVPAGTAFEDLPHHFGCEGCGSEKEAFSKIEPAIRSAATNICTDAFWRSAKYTGSVYHSER